MLLCLAVARKGFRRPSDHPLVDGHRTDQRKQDGDDLDSGSYCSELPRTLVQMLERQQQLEVEHTTVTPGKTVSGKFIKGPIKGTWKYAYAEKDGGTKLTYSMDYEPNGFAARLFFGIIEKQVPGDLVRTLASLKKYVESGKGPKRGDVPPVDRARRSLRAANPPGAKPKK